MAKAYFLADLHLGASYDDKSREVERSAVKFLDSIKDDASEIYLLGDILDYWFEYKHVVPRGYVRFFGKLAELADAGIKITWIIGNHDIWIFDYLPNELGIDVVDGVIHHKINGIDFCMQHGDAIGGSRKFRLMRSLFRNRFCQKLYSGIHPRFTVGFAKFCSRRSRLSHSTVEELAGNLIDDIRQWCVDDIERGDMSKYFVFGHLHATYNEELPDGRKLIVLPAWHDRSGYGVFDGHHFLIEYFEAN